MGTIFFHTKPERNKRRATFAGIVEGKTISIGVSVCSTKDNFQKKLGRTIAEGRARKNPTCELHFDDFPIKTFLEFAKTAAAQAIK
jgi:hypothetical protein